MAEASTSAPPPKKTVLKETPQLPQPVPSTSATLKPSKKNEYLKTCFDDIINKKTLLLNSKIISDILFHDLRIQIKNLSTMMKYVISECLCNYMKIWPGWEEYRHTGAESLGECFLKFKEYLKFKIDFIIENQKQFYDDEAKPAKQTTDMQTQTESASKENKPEAPYSLVICGQPNILNNIVFIEIDNNVVIKQHLEKSWKQLIPTEFFNYPYVSVTVNLPSVKLTRSNIHEYRRYITDCGANTASAPDVDFINYVVKSDKKADTKVYAYEYVAAYFSQFVKVFNKVGVKVLPQLQVLFNEFLKDMKESCSQNKTMATPYTVCYNIGRKTYIRNKKMVVNSQKDKENNALNYCEILIPKVAFTLTELNVEEDVMTPDVTFTDLNRIGVMPLPEILSIVQQVNNCMTYECLLCPKQVQGENAHTEMMDHFRYLHKGEQAVLCFKCRRQFEVYTLANQRWAHECAEPKAASAPPRKVVPIGSPGPSSRPPTIVNGAGSALRHIAPAPYPSTSRNQMQARVDPKRTVGNVNTPITNVPTAVPQVQQPQQPTQGGQ